MQIRNFTSGLSAPAQWLIDWVRGPEASSGVPVTTDAALSYAPVYHACQKISSHVAQLPCNLYRQGDGEQELLRDDPIQVLLNVRPGDFLTPFTMKQTVMLHALLFGNGRAAIIRRRGLPAELIPLQPNNTITCLVEGKKWHVVVAGQDDRCAHVPGGPSKFRDGKVYKIPDRDCLHIPGMSFDGYKGMSLMSLGREAMGLGLASEKATGAIFKNPKPGVILTAPVGAFTSAEDAQEFIDNFNKYHLGTSNAGRAALMREGMTAETLNISAEDAQWIQQRQFQRQEIAMLFGLEGILGDGEKQNYNTFEQKQLAYMQNTLMPWLCRWEEELRIKLLPRQRRADHVFKFDISKLLRADMETRVNAYSTMITSRVMSPNEVRAEFDMNPYEGGDTYSNPAITPGQESDQEPEAEPEEQDEPPDGTQAARAAIVARLRHLIGVEARRVRDAAASSKNYLAWQEKFYTKWPITLGNAIEEFGGDRALAFEHCRRSDDEMLVLSGQVQADKFAQATEELTELWPDRAEALADQIMETRS